MNKNNFMKKTLIALFLASLATSVYAQDELTISKLTTDQDTMEAFQKMTANQNLPKWITQGELSLRARKLPLQAISMWC